MRVTGKEYLWGTAVLLVLYFMAEWWLLKMLLISIASVLAVAYSATNEEEDQ